MTWALGHLATLKEPHDYDPALKKWSLAALPIVPERFGIKPIEEGGARKQLAVVRRLFRDADELISATDAGREGELIFRYIQELVGSTGKPARRLWLSSLTESAIRDAFRRLRPLSDYDNLYAAARSRSEADWVVGLNATRYYTVRHRTGGILWSVGRVQTPVLAMIVRRDDEIRTFKPEPFWELLTRYREVTFKFAGDRFAKEEDAQALLQRVLGRPFTIRGVEKKPERVPPPQLYDLTELQRDMNRRYGMSADATLKVAQSLYEDKLISYPRTDSRYLGQDMKAQVPGILEELRALKPAEIGRLDLSALPFTGRIVNNAKVSDHHAIIPTGKRPGTLAPAAQKVYDAVATRLIAAFYPACVKEVTTVNGTSDDVPFRARGVRVLDPGWTVLYPRKQDDGKDKEKEEEQELPEFRAGETGPHEPFVRRGETTPPKSYTENTLLGAMETAGKLVEEEALKEALKERGLGTPATRAAIIETLLDRGYITRDKKSLAATDLGRYLIAIVQDRALKSPELTGDWEAKLRQVERGRARPSRVHGGSRTVHRRHHPLGRRGRGQPGPARRLSPMRTPRDRGQARIRMLGLARRLPVRALARVPRRGADRGSGPGAAPAPRAPPSPDDRRGPARSSSSSWIRASWRMSPCRPASRRARREIPAGPGRPDRAARIRPPLGSPRPQGGAGGSPRRGRRGSRSRGAPDRRARRSRASPPRSRRRASDPSHSAPAPSAAPTSSSRRSRSDAAAGSRAASSRSGRRSPARPSGSARPRPCSRRGGARC